MPQSKPTKPQPRQVLVPKPARKKREEEEEPQDVDAALAESDAEMQSEEEAVSSGAESEEEGEEEVSDEDESDDDEEEDQNQLTPEQLEARKKKKEKDAETRRTVKAKRRGHRTIALKAGFSAKHASHQSSRDVCEPVLSLSETIKAAKWAPALATEAAFEGLGEFEERTNLAYESLPPGPAKILRDNGEIFLRRLVTGTIMRQADMSRTSPSVAMVAAETRPLKRALKYSFVGPELKGLVRFAQTAQSGQLLKMFDGEATQIKKDKGYAEQVEVQDRIKAEAKKRKEAGRRRRTRRPTRRRPRRPSSRSASPPASDIARTGVHLVGTRRKGCCEGNARVSLCVALARAYLARATACGLAKRCPILI